WSWDFGDGSAAVLTQNANHTYAAPGTYVITLTASNGSCSSSSSITVNATIFNFSANDTLTCSGIVQFTDLANNGATAWIWQFGDGGSSTLQNPAHTYASAGYFTVTFTTVGINGIDSLVKTNYIHVALLAAPTVSNDTTICQYNPVTLTASGGIGTIAWFDSISGGSQVGSGSPFTSGPLVATTTFYAASQQSSGSMYGGPADTTIGTGAYYAFNVDRYLTFNCLTACRLVSVLVFSDSAGARTIYLADNMGNQLNSVTVNVPVGQTQVNLNFDIQPGNNYRLGNAGNSRFFRNDAGAVYPYNINGQLSITGNNAGGGGNGFYYFFYNWEVSNPPCSSPRVPVTITVTPGPQASFVYTQNLNSFTCTDLSLGATNWSWDFGDGSAAVTTQNAVHAYATSGTYTITLTAGNGTCSSSQSVTVNATFAGIDEHSLSLVSLQPNPVKDILTVNLPGNASKVRMSVTNSFGQLIYETQKNEIVNKTASINLSSYSSGVYILKIESNDQVVLKKIIKE
ncbi:MAG: PKD domain-containing protein, partial [Bacteroidia bacterium]